ncbi:MAG: sialate O-acetylesterase, partial [Opitutales bacterium]
MLPRPVLLFRLAAGLALLLTALRADVTPAALFGDHAVLQEGLPLPVWGTAPDGEEVTVEFAGQRAQTLAQDGRWMVRLAPVTAGGPYTMVISGRNRIVFTDLLVGEVWLCSGQSNMEMRLGPKEGMQPVINWPEAVATADLPQLRCFTVPRVNSLTPKSQTEGSWELSSPATAPRFSAVAFFFGRALLQARHVPIGLIHSSWGGSSAEAWMSGEALQQQPDFAEALAEQALSLRDPVAAN